MEGDPCDHAAVAQQTPRERQRPVELVELVVDGDSQCLEGALGGMAAGEARRCRKRRVDRLDELERRLDRRLRAPAHDCTGDRAGVALLAEVAQRARQAPLVPRAHDLPRAQLLRRIHPHVERGLIRIGEPALTRVYLHRGHTKVEIRRVGAHPFAGEQLERFGVARADEAHGALDVLRELREALLGERVAVDRDQRARRPESLGHEPRVPAVAERAVDRRLARLGVEQLEQLVGQHRHVAARADRGVTAGGLARSCAGSARRPPALGASLGSSHLKQCRRHLP